MNKRICNNIWLICFWAAGFAGCKQVYTPPSIKGNTNFLVVDGILVNGPDSTIIRLSRTRSLADTVPTIPELSAQVQVQGSGADIYPLTEIGNGEYAVNQLSLNPNEQYQLQIITASGSRYLSDFVPVSQNPPIDSLHWRLDSTGLSIYVNTHDPLALTKYYRWHYVETWEHRSNFGSYYFYTPGGLQRRDTSQQIYRCWTSRNSSSILVATSSALNQDIIYEYPLLSIPLGAEEVSQFYSLDVKQYGLTMAGYDYWLNLRKISQETGTLFDPQPSQITGNIHCINNPTEPVLGFVSASGESELRIFIDRGQVSFWPYFVLAGCTLIGVPATDLITTFSDTLQWVPINGLLGGAYSGTTLECGDCRSAGGTTLRPLFWPN